jgi:hypothetical protein
MPWAKATVADRSFSLYGSTGGSVLAMGSISMGIGAEYACTNDNGEPTTCFTEVGYVDEGAILGWLGADIMTAG